MFTATVLLVRPEQECVAPPHTGRAVQAWFLNLVRAHDARLAEQLHHGPDEAGGTLRPYTVSDVVGLGPVRDDQRLLSPERPGWLRITALTPELSTLIRTRLLAGLPGAVIGLAGAFLRVESVAVTQQEHPRAGEATAEALLSAYSLAPDAPRRLTLRFFSPTAFRSDDAHVPFPLPRLVFGSLVQKWNAFAPMALQDEARLFAEARLAASKFGLRTRYVNDERSPTVGAVGVCRYVIRSSDRYWIGVIRTLAAFSFFAGVGARTVLGLGQAGLWDEQTRRAVIL